MQKGQGALTISGNITSFPLPQLNLSSSANAVLMYPFYGVGSILLQQMDVERLETGRWLNDSLIQFGLKYVLITCIHTLSPLASLIHDDIKHSNPFFGHQIYVANTFFYTKLRYAAKILSFERLTFQPEALEVSNMCQDGLPASTYFRWSIYLSLFIVMGECSWPFV